MLCKYNYQRGKKAQQLAARGQVLGREAPTKGRGSSRGDGTVLCPYCGDVPRNLYLGLLGVCENAVLT